MTVITPSMTRRSLGRLILLACLTFAGLAAASSANVEDVGGARGPVSIGPQAARIVVGFRAAAAHRVAQVMAGASRHKTMVTQADKGTAEVIAPSQGGGALDWWDTLFAVGVLLAGRRHVKRRPTRDRQP